MVHFERMDYPEQNRTSYHVIDDYGNKAQLTAEQAYELLRWLYDRRNELTTAIHPQAKQKVPDWLLASPEKATQMPTVRYLEIRLHRQDWQYLDALKAAIPTLQEEDEVRDSQEKHQPVKVFRVKYDSLSQEALKLLDDLQIETQVRDQLVPMSGEDKES